MSKMKSRNYEYLKKFFRIFYICLLLLVEALLFFYVWKLHYVKDVYFAPFYFWGDIYLTILYTVFLFLFMQIFGGVKLGYLNRKSTLYTQLLSTICGNLTGFLLIILLFRGIPSLVPLVELTTADGVIVFIITYFFEKIFYKTFPARKLLLIYGSSSTEQIQPKMEGRGDRFDIVSRMKASEDIHKIEDEILKYDGVVLSDVCSQRRNRILKFCYGKSIRVYMTPKISDVMIRSAEMLHIFDSPLLLARNYGLAFYQRAVKRILDIMISSMLIVVTLPIMIVIGICIKAYDGGPIFFQQERLTRKHRKFNMLKFRSMVTDAEKENECILATKNDDRVTPIGEFIRRTRLDELPQLFNVFIGDMSMVGPRPERPALTEKYEEEMPEFAFRLGIKAGLTGYAQVYGKYNTTPYDKLKMDLIYIENYSFWQDWKIMIMTLKVIFMKGSAEGVDEG